MSALVHIRCNSRWGASSSVEFAMACLRRGFHNLSSSNRSTTLSSLSSSSAPLVGTYKVGKSHNHNNYNYASWCYSSGIQIPGVHPLIVRAVVGVRSCVSITDSRSSSKKEVRKLNSSVDNRFCFTRSGSCLINHSPGLILGGERKEGEIGSRKNFVVTTESSLGLSLESSFGQVSGDLEQESEDASGDSFPRGTYQSSPHEHSAVHIHHDHSAVHDADHAHDHSALHGATHDHHSGPYSTATITEVLDVGLMAELEDALGFPLGHRPQSPCPKPLVIVISGPSGVGKDAVIKKLQHARGDIHFVVTATTRAMRPNEIDGVDYHFMSKTEFQEMIENHELLEHAIVYGDYKGIPKQQVREFMSQGMDVVLRVDVQGAATVRSILGSEAVFIFLVAESEVALVKRLAERKTETMDKMLVRVATAREELTRMDEFDYVVVNQEGCLDRTVSLICNIIEAEKARVKPKSAEI